MSVFAGLVLGAGITVFVISLSSGGNESRPAASSDGSQPPADATAPTEPTPEESEAVPPASPTPTATASSTPTQPTLPPTPTPLPPTPTPELAPPPPTPAPEAPQVAAPDGTLAAETVERWYRLVSSQQFEAAYALWSERMKSDFPRQGNLDNRWASTAGVTIHSLQVVEWSESRASVAIDFTETSRSGSERRFRGSWELVWVDGQWLLDQPHF
jgi:hypothetical protein